MTTPAGHDARPANRLIHSTSPYLLQHARNPVDWHPWGPDALTLAAADDKPIFLSIGYSACHWCHVMERESFESPAIAELLNRDFVCIKVDREERPDLDEVYMAFVQAFTGHGGWPMSTFLTPDGRPFFGGTYWPPERRRGMPGFPDVLRHVKELWTTRRATVLEQAGQSVEFLRENSLPPEGDAELSDTLVQRAAAALARGFDTVNGGFGSAPKFPHGMELSLFLRVHARTGKPEWRDMVELACERMARGGIYDHLAGGFARYSVDARWAVPHFEKMLYDNALLPRTYLELQQVTGDRFYGEVARETFEWVLAEMRSAEGAFHSTLDADSEGEEGKFYVWSPAEIREALGDELGELACRWFDVTEEGNFEHTGRSTLTTPKTVGQLAAVLGTDAEALQARLEEARRGLLAARSGRVRPGCDDKIITAWNGLMIAALARGAAVLGEPRYAEAAGRAADHVLSALSREGRLLRTARAGKAHLAAYAEDYAAMIEGLVDLYEATFDTARLRQAAGLAETLLKHHYDREAGGFFFTADDGEALVVRSKNWADNATPSGNSTAVDALLRLAAYTDRADFREAAERTLKLFAQGLAERPFATACMVAALDRSLAEPQEVVLAGAADHPEVVAALAEVRRRFHRNRIVALRPPDAGAEWEAALPWAAGKGMLDGRPTFWVCRNRACDLPVHTAAELAERL